MKVYFFDISELNSAQEEKILLLNGFPVVEKERISRLRQKSDRLLSACGFLLMDYANIPISGIRRTEYNQAYTDETNLKFSISHSGTLVTIAISEQTAPGIDIELKRRLDVTDFHGVMTTEEQEEINDLDSFFVLWTAKEAIIKALGMGFQLDPKNIYLKGDTGFLNGKQWHLHEISISKDYHCTLASESRHEKVSVTKLGAGNLMANQFQPIN